MKTGEWKMAGYTAIVDVGNMLVQLLKDEMVPDVISGSHGIGLCSPNDKGDFALGIHLYDIRECEEVRTSGMLNTGWDRQQFPPMFVSLYYMITAYSDSDLKFRAAEEQRILGRAMQILYDHAVVPSGLLSNRLSGLECRIELMNPELDEKLKLWNTPDTPYKASLFYRVTPVEVESARTRSVTRVTSITYCIEE